jgi:putative hydrolase of the HAD superfamily
VRGAFTPSNSFFPFSTVEDDMAAVFFDVDGTLVRWPDAYPDVLADGFERALGRVEDDWLAQYDERFFHHFDAVAPDPYRRAFADVCERFDLDVDPGTLVEALVEREFEAVEPVPGVERTLAALADRHTLGLLTNGVPRVQFGKVERVGLGEHFSVRVASHDSEVGAMKPDPDIFEAARERVDAEQLVMVGDAPEADIDGARDQGFEVVHVDAEATELSAPDFRTLATLL